jgi:hypothetical protein
MKTYLDRCNAEPGSYRHTLALICDDLVAAGKPEQAAQLWRDSGFEALLKAESELEAEGS